MGKLPIATAKGALNEVESLYFSALAVLLEENGGSMRMSQAEYDAHRNMDFMFIMEDGFITIKVGKQLDG